MKQVTTTTGPAQCHPVRSRWAQSRLARFGRALKRRGEEGMAIAEYAIGILIVAAIGLVIFTLIRSDHFQASVSGVVTLLFNVVTSLWS
ncbi:MAG: DUF4244 domain-containing protein [Propionibacteriaceae bacterium]|jgi:hypothetical protein|nr:DUF4244 domain-containing protein [Propionibacteriaceae bacterium]